MNLPELTPKLLALSAAEKADAIKILTQSLDLSGIEKTPGVCGGDARIAGTRIPVWGLVNYRRLDATDADILEGFPHLTQADLDRAWAYAEKYPEEIEAAIKRNDEP